MSFDQPIEFRYLDYTGFDEKELYWRVAYQSGETLIVVTKTKYGKPELNYLEYLKGKGAVFKDDPKHPIREIWRSLANLNDA